MNFRTAATCAALTLASVECGSPTGPSDAMFDGDVLAGSDVGIDVADARDDGRRADSAAPLDADVPTATDASTSTDADDALTNDGATGSDADAGGVDPAHLFSAASPWNTPTPSGTSWYDTPVLHQLGDGSFRHWWINTASVGIWWCHGADPNWTFNLPDYIALAWHRDRPAASFAFNAPADMAPGTDSDHILVAINADSGDYVELWQAQVDSTALTATNMAGSPGWARGNVITGPGAGTLANNDGVRAANFSWAAGLITGADLTAGRIDHALVVALTSDTLMGGGSTGYAYGQSSGTLAYRPPATAWDAGPWTGPIQMGSRLGVPAGAARPAGLSPVGNMVFDALQRYGAFVGDYAGGQWPMFYADDRTVTEAQVDSVFAYWNYAGSSDMEKIAPLLRVADYQP